MISVYIINRWVLQMRLCTFVFVIVLHPSGMAVLCKAGKKDICQFIKNLRKSYFLFIIVAI